MENRPVSPQTQTQEEQLQQSLRPTTWDGYFGQPLLKENVKILDTKVKTDLKRLFTIIKKENYRGYLPLETLGPGDPYKKVTNFLDQVKNELYK